MIRQGKHALGIALIVAFSAAAGHCAQAQAHLGLLSDREISIYLDNARETLVELFPDDKLSACRPFDVAPSVPLTGVVFCKLVTPRGVNSQVRFMMGPDLFCSYLEAKLCQYSINKADTYEYMN